METLDMGEVGSVGIETNPEVGNDNGSKILLHGEEYKEKENLTKLEYEQSEEQSLVLSSQSENEKVQADWMDDENLFFTQRFKNHWTVKNWKGIFLHIVTTLCFVTVPSYTDQWSDTLLGYSYLTGADYTVNLHNLTEGLMQNCTHLYTTVVTHPQLPTPTSTVYTFTCHQTDPMYGIVTLTLTFLPGVWMAYRMRDGYTSMWYKVCLLLVAVTFPLQLLIVKAVLIINPEMKIWSDQYTMFESQFESAIQICVQIFIVLSHADRQASYIQMFTILVSGGMVIKNTMANFLISEKKDQAINMFLAYFPLFMTTIIFRILSLVVISVLLRWNCVYFYAAVIGTALLLRMLAGKYLDLGFTLFRQMDEECLAMTGSITTRGKKQVLSNILLWTTVNCVSLTTLAVLVHHDDHLQTCMPDLFPFPLDCHAWAEMPLAAHFNLLYGVCMVTGALSLTLFLFQVFWAEKRPGGELYE